MIYFDNSATTKTNRDALDIMCKYYGEKFFNPSSLYTPSVAVLKDLKNAKANIAKKLNVTSEEIYFVSSGSEANNTVLKGVNFNGGKKLIISSLEHDSVYNTAMTLKNKGIDVLECSVLQNGLLNLDYFENLIDEKVALVSVIHINNLTGAINDIKAISEILKRKSPNAMLHIDGVQSFNKLKIDLKLMNVDFFSSSAHKFNAPKGVGFLYVKNGRNIAPLINGGGQENGLRASTENTGGIMAMDYMVNNYNTVKIENCRHILKYIKQEITNIDSEIKIITDIDSDKFAPNILSFAMKNVRAEVILHLLEQEEIYISTGSACTSKKRTNRTAKALKLANGYDEGFVRISLGLENTFKEGENFIESFKKHYTSLRNFIRR